VSTLATATDKPALLDRPTTLLFAIFFASGFCGLLYQVVWVRLAFAHFGIITPVLSVVVSVFMLGLGIGSVTGGLAVEAWSRRIRLSPLVLYAAAEFGIGVGAFIVPHLFVVGEAALLQLGDAGSSRYLLVSAVYIAVAVLPWCILMGATFPLMMGFVRQVSPAETTSFSFLYLANVAGAMAGAVVTAVVLVELIGFRSTCTAAAVVNFTISATCLFLAWRYRGVAVPPPHQGVRAVEEPPAADRERWAPLILFTTGFASLAMEVVWTRAFTYVLTTTVYAFAAILAVYLLATWLGSLDYRRDVARNAVHSTGSLLGMLCLFALLPAILDDPRLQQGAALTLASIVPICAGLGYLTPKLIDQTARGDPARAGRAYAWNIAGSILGPLAAAYLLLPSIGVKSALVCLAAPFALLYLWSVRRTIARAHLQQATLAGVLTLFFVAGIFSRSFEDGTYLSPPIEVRRDYAATVIAAGTGMSKQLLVNGIGITALTPITKVMAHLPLALNGHARSGLVICFGMGTSTRSMLSWGIDTTAVDLVPSVPKSFGFFFADAPAVLANPRLNIVIDDGRRYLLRSQRRYDVIVVDPPPPIEAAGSSLLYSREFYTLVKAHLQPNGIFAQWFPGADGRTLEAVTRSLRDSFPYLRIYGSIEGWGYHFLASQSPIPELSAAEFVARLPPAARQDLTEWGPKRSPLGMAQDILSRPIDPDRLLPPGKTAEITDDRPFNEYFFLRQELARWRRLGLGL